jgi:hypothetical protein
VLAQAHLDPAACAQVGIARGVETLATAQEVSAPTADQPVVAGAAAQEVVAAPALEQVTAVIAAQNVVTATALERVVATAPPPLPEKA